MIQPSVKTRRALKPLSWLYGFGVWIHNKLYDWKILKSKKFPIPVICVGNITVGGTGKTPHIEYLIQILSGKYKVAVLSRGYKRKSKGLKQVETSSLASDVGDEPLQIKQKYPDALVVVDKNRCRAIESMLAMDKENKPDVILLDDGFQHRRVQPSFSILLVDSNRPIYQDSLLPAGNLREPVRNVNRASMVVVTKCSKQMQPIDYRIFSNELDLYPYQSLCFTYFEYDNLKPVFGETENEDIQLNDLLKKHVLLVAGIASPQPLVDKLEKKTYNLYTLFFPDHHAFEKTDIEAINNKISEIDDDDIIIVTTEKDAVRFRENEWVGDKLKQLLYYIPINVNFVRKSEQFLFYKKINNHVRDYQSNSRLPKR